MDHQWSVLVCNARALIYIFSLRFLDLCMSPLQATLHVVARQSVHRTGNLLVNLKHLALGGIVQYKNIVFNK